MSARHRRGAWAALWQQYRGVFRQAWKERKSMGGGGLLSADEAAFLPAALSLQEQPLSATARWTGRVLMSMVVFLFGWSIFGQIDINVTASGKVVPSSRNKTIASVDVAAVRALYVQEGQRVRAGEVLLELDTSASDAERDKAQGDAVLAALQVARSEAMIAALSRLQAPQLKPNLGANVSAEQWGAAQRQLRGQWDDFHAKLMRLDVQIASYQQDLPLVTQRANDFKFLLQAHDVSAHAWIEKEQARTDLVARLADAKSQRLALIAQTAKESHDLLTEGTRVTAASSQDARRAGAHSQLLRLTAPVDGTVEQLNVHSVGAAVPAAQALMVIVPLAQQVELEAFLENKDVGFVQEGQRVEVKIEAFDYSKYGTVAGRVSHVSRDAIQDDKKGLVYAVKIALDKAAINVDGQSQRLSAGMSGSAEIKTGTRRVIEYVLSPLVRHQREALHER